MPAGPLTVLVTGAGTGIGLALTRALLQAGHRVFAGARKPGHLSHLQALGATALPLDVTDPDQVAQVAQAIGQAGGGLHGLVHNAGVGGLGLLPGWSDADMRALFDTHVFGPHRLTRVLMPHLLAAALEAAAPAQPADAPESDEDRRPAPPEAVAAVALQALTAPHPQRRYLAGTRWESDRVIATLLDRLLDAAHSPSQQLSRARLLERLANAWDAREAKSPR